MPGTIIRLDTTFTDAALPTVPNPDPILTAGSLLLIDPTNPQEPWDAGVPTSGLTVPNLAWAPAATAIGSGTKATLAATFVDDLSAANGLVERSTKGGLHGIIKHQAFTTTEQAYLSQGAVHAYMTANPTNDYYMSLWGYLTRDDTYTATGGALRMAGIETSTFGDSMLIRRQSSALALQPTTNRIGSRLATRDLAPFLVTGAVSQLTGTPSTSETLVRWQFGSSEGGQVKMPSYVMYRFYVEDLTVSGRSYAEVDALDLSLYTAAVTTSGGRYEGDTFTDPLTI